MDESDNNDQPQIEPVIDIRNFRHRAAVFKRIRLDHSLEITEDYIELISDLIETTGEARAVDLASTLGVSKPTVNAENDAEGIENHVSQATLDAFEKATHVLKEEKLFNKN